MFRKIILLIFFVGAIIIIASNIDFDNLIKKEPATDEIATDVQDINVLENRFCYIRENPTSSGFYDLTFLDMIVAGDKVRGELVNLPAETDSKVGDFEGEIMIDDGVRKVFALWNSFAEGMRTTEELIIKLEDDFASVAFGQMEDRGDGVWTYVDTDNLNYVLRISSVDCEDFDDRVLVDSFIKQNISELAPEDPVLGGTFYVISVSVDPSERRGEFVYEDGHIQGRASFNYVRFGEEVLINNILKID